jgi:hypothetical protein
MIAFTRLMFVHNPALGAFWFFVVLFCFCFYPINCRIPWKNFVNMPLFRDEPEFWKLIVRRNKLKKKNTGSTTTRIILPFRINGLRIRTIQFCPSFMATPHTEGTFLVGDLRIAIIALIQFILWIGYGLWITRKDYLMAN